MAYEGKSVSDRWLDVDTPLPELRFLGWPEAIAPSTIDDFINRGVIYVDFEKLEATVRREFGIK